MDTEQELILESIYNKTISSIHRSDLDLDYNLSMRWVGHVARMGEKRKAYRLLVGKPEGKRPLGRPRRRWVDNIKMDLLEIGWGGVD
jgi:hypothetical protein